MPPAARRIAAASSITSTTIRRDRELLPPTACAISPSMAPRPFSCGASCHEHYDEVVTKEPAVPFPYEHVTAFIARHLDRVPFVRRVEKRVAVHYHTGFAQSDLDWQNARAILRAIPGLELVEIANPSSLGRHCAPKWIGRVGRPQWQNEIDRSLWMPRGMRASISSPRSIIPASGRSARRKPDTRSLSSTI